VNIATFADVAARLYKAYLRKTYRKLYPWLDKITQERDSSVLSSLNQAMVAKINLGDLDKIWLAVPEILNWEEIDGFTYRVPSTNPKKPGPVLHPDIDLDEWMTESKLKGQVTLNHRKRLGKTALAYAGVILNGSIASKSSTVLAFGSSANKRRRYA
jgi:uncharacterized protein (TIGR04141 family)